MAGANYYRDVDSWWVPDTCTRFCSSTFHIHPLLGQGKFFMYILGISAFYHDSGACLLKDGEIIAAAQEERFTRKKHDADFPIMQLIIA
jgi:hypothetical protein